jgi:virginiamycin B lyase
VREWPSPTPASGPYGIAIGTDGRIWYNEARSNLMVAFNPINAQMETVTIPTPGCVVRHMVVDRTRKRLWLALSGTGRIGRLDL